MSTNYIRPTIAVDLDETLVHVTSIAPVNLDNSNSFTFILKKNRFYVQTRPNLKYFLEKLSELVNVYIFTASSKEYANKIIDKILPNLKECRRFFRDSCINEYGYYMKDLSKINSPINKILLVDDLTGSALLYPKNLVRIKPWNGDKNDKVLLDLISIFEKISTENDIRDSFIEIIKNGNYDGINTFT